DQTNRSRGPIQQGLAVECAPATVVGQWPMNEGSGQILHDASGHGHDAVLGETPDADGRDPAWDPADQTLSYQANAYAAVPSSKAFETPHLTVETWLKITEEQPDRYAISYGYLDDSHPQPEAYGLWVGSEFTAFFVNTANGV